MELLFLPNLCAAQLIHPLKGKDTCVKYRLAPTPPFNANHENGLQVSTVSPYMCNLG